MLDTSGIKILVFDEADQMLKVHSVSCPVKLLLVLPQPRFHQQAWTGRERMCIPAVWYHDETYSADILLVP